MTDTTRRALLGATAAALPVAAGFPALASDTPDPLPALVAEWVKAENVVVEVWSEVVDVDFDDALHRNANRLFEQILDTTPQTLEGVMAMLRFHWELYGPCSIYGSDEWRDERAYPEHRAMLQAMRAVAAMLPEHVRPSEDDLLQQMRS
jgi:hypothetical protein